MTIHDLPELAAIGRLLAPARAVGGSTALLTLARGGARTYPVHVFRFGGGEPGDPVLFVLGGVHGLERIGAEVAIAYLHTLVAQLGWDDVLRHALARARIVVVPLLNPIGTATRRRANGNGVDLMRNAPVNGRSFGTPLVGGQRWSAWLPWYMGPPGAPMEPEAAALCELVEREVFPSRSAIALDLHSGYGVVDRLWYPYARTREPPPDLPAIAALSRLLDRTLPNHVYQVEQTARVYTIQGDLWDHLYDRRRAAGPGLLVPLTLEMGSWAWVRKNPLQGMTSLGRFNPVQPHRRRRILRRHLMLLDFLFRAACAGPSAWDQKKPVASSS